MSNLTSPLHIDIPTDEDIESAKSMDLQRIEKNLQNISSSSISLPSRKDSVEHLVGQKLGNGKFSTVSIYTPDSSKVIREAHGFQYISKHLNHDHKSMMEQIERFVTDLQQEPSSIHSFSTLKTIFPNNIIELFDHFPCKNKKYYQNNFIMERVYGIVLSKLVDTDIDLTDVIALFFQAYYIIIYANMNGLFHNDLKWENLMVSNERYDITLEGLILDGTSISIQFKDALILKFIDYAFAREIKKTNLIPIETISIVNIFSSIIDSCKLDETNAYDTTSDENYETCILKDFDIFTQDLLKLDLASWNKRCINVSPHSLYHEMRKLDEVDAKSIIDAFKNFNMYDTNKIKVNITQV